MNVIKPNVEYWDESGISMEDHVARCASVCYKSKPQSSTKLCDVLKRDGHISMFRHSSAYYIVPMRDIVIGTVLHNTLYLVKLNPYVFIYYGSKEVFISTNLQFVMDHFDFSQTLRPYKVSVKEFKEQCPDHTLFRFTFCIDTSILVTRELNRVSPNNIAEQSTRYVNFFTKDGDVSICESVTDKLLSAADIAIIRQQQYEACECYKNLIASKIPPEIARRVLPLDTVSKVAYTYTLKEWSHILDLRYFEKTGKAAPDAKYIASLIYNKFIELGYLHE